MSPCGRFTRFRRTQSFVFLVTCPTCPINVSDLTSRGDQCTHPKSSQAKLSQDQQSVCNSPHQISNKLNTGQWSMLPTAYLPQPNSSTPSTLYCIWLLKFIELGGLYFQEHHEPSYLYYLASHMKIKTVSPRPITPHLI